MRCDHGSRAGSLALDGCERRCRAVDDVLLHVEGSRERRGDGGQRAHRGGWGSGGGAARLSIDRGCNALTLGRRHRRGGRRSSGGCACSGNRSGGSRARGAGRQRAQRSLLCSAARRRRQLRDADGIERRRLLGRTLRRLALCCRRCSRDRSRRSCGRWGRYARSLGRLFALVRIVAHARNHQRLSQLARVHARHLRPTLVHPDTSATHQTERGQKRSGVARSGRHGCSRSNCATRLRLRLSLT